MKKNSGRIRRKVIFIIVGICIFAICVLAAGMVLSKKWQINPWFAKQYDLQGVDVSHYQGSIDWMRIQEQGIDFVFIKATEGSGYVDEYFYDNWKMAAQTDMYVGAYHFFSFDSDAKAQAGLFIDTVGDLSGKIAPVIDIEYYGDKRNSPPEKEAVVSQLGEMIQILENHYHTKPIIYTTYSAYKRYINEEFAQYPLWIRNVYYPPGLIMGKRWTFWQYQDTAVLDGYSGDEKYIDRNVFRGSPEEMEKFLVGQR